MNEEGGIVFPLDVVAIYFPKIRMSRFDDEVIKLIQGFVLRGVSR